MGYSMTSRKGSPLAAAAASLAIFASTAPLAAAELPPIKASESNKVAECATPGRLMAYLKERNQALAPKYEGLATEYMRHGEALGLRWEYAFFQMLLETGYLTYTGDVKPEQNNFAGLGASGGGARGESFPDISTGARAHLEHLTMYSGQKVENPVAQRTRNIQEWGVLTSWQRSIQGPITFTQMAKQWAPTSKGYTGDIKRIADRFFEGPCKGEDPHPEYVAAARGQPSAITTAAAPAETDTSSDAASPVTEAKVTEPKGADLPAATVAEASAESDVASAAKGTAPAASATAKTAASEPAASTPSATAPDKAVVPVKAEEAAPPVKLLNSAPPAKEAASTDTPAPIETASVAGAAKDAVKPAESAKKAAQKCRVWTASYGGAKAIIIKAMADQTTNYTVLDVNEGAEKREADAYINAYAKGGESVGEFASQTQALDKAFELCPEG